MVRADPRPQPPALSQHHAEQPNRAKKTRLRGERDLEIRKVHLRQLTRPGLEAPCQLSRNHRPDQAMVLRQRQLGSLITHRLDLAMHPARREAEDGPQAARQIRPKTSGQSFPRFPRPVERFFQPPLKMFPHRLAIQHRLPHSRNKAQALTLPFQNHQRPPPALPPARSFHGASRKNSAPEPVRGGHHPPTVGTSAQLGHFHPELVGEIPIALIAPKDPHS